LNKKNRHLRIPEVYLRLSVLWNNIGANLIKGYRCKFDTDSLISPINIPNLTNRDDGAKNVLIQLDVQILNGLENIIAY